MFTARQNSKTTGKIILATALVFLSAMLSPTANAGIPIENLQREFQARFHFATWGNYVVWPACRSGLPAPLFPPDGFYGNLDNDPHFAAYLVQDLANQFFGGSTLYGSGFVRWPLYYVGYPLF